MEKYVKGSKNLWHSIWILITILLIPILLIILKFDFLGQSNLILSIGCDFILMSYMFNILWIMLLYLKISIKSPMVTPLRKAGVLIALGLGMSFYIIVMKIGMFIMAESYVPAYLGGTLAEGINEFDLEVIIRELPGFFAFIFFNLGFYLIKPIQIEE
ncbi:MAG: hypothetical protein GY870_02890 [archaeon]|nr:hypothetical protein [archaeon]